MRKKEYCYKAKLNPEYILYIGYVFGKYHVFATNENHTYNYSVYGGYEKLGTAENKLLNSVYTYKGGDVELYFASKDMLLKHGAFELD